uniref:Putative serine protease h6 n=1 Tax=Panstrongylus lignarius TaxID=156445 RepID=A0A224X7T3_9HEMI
MDFKLIGTPCGEHGPYIFYKALKYNKNGKTNILALSEFFFVKLWTDSDLISIGELQLLWEDKNNEQTLASLRLYILPENTPDGRTDMHGEDEVLAISEKVVIRVEDLLTWITQATDWHWGLNAIWERNCLGPSPLPAATPALDMDDIAKEKLTLDETHWETYTGVVVLSYPRYCRYRGVIKRVEGVEDKWLRTSLVVALGGITAPCKNTRILFCKDTFDYPDLEGHELLCNHLAPKLKGRPRKRKKASMSPEASGSESESSHSTSSTTSKVKPTPPITKVGLVKPRLRCTLEVNKRPVRGPTSEEKNFLALLHNFMRERRTPISKIPVVGFKEVNLYKLYKKVRELGGYDMVTAGKLWKFVYEVMGGDMTSTSAATLSRRHYERLLLPYERHMNGIRTTPKIRPTLSLPPVPLPRNSQTQDSNTNKANNTNTNTNNTNTNTNTNSNSKNKNNLLITKTRLKQEKVLVEKENIPQRREPSKQQQVKLEVPKQIPKPVKLEPEVIDLSEDSPVKLSNHPQVRAMSPMLKKQKLEILKEGGLEVTPVGGTGRVSVIKQTVSQPSLPPIKQSCTPPPLPPPLPPPPPPPPPSRHSQPICPTVGNKISITVTPDIDMSHLLSPGPSKRPIYGNPKELFHSQRSQPTEVLDLRTTKQKLNFGSNLEITLVEAPVQQPPKPVNVPRRPHHPQPHHHFRPQPAAVILPYTPSPNPSPNASTPGRAAYPTFKPFLPPMDPLYLSAIYGGMFSASGSNYRHPTPSEHLYKELIRRQGIFPAPLIHDGTTSITLTTPTSK